MSRVLYHEAKDSVNENRRPPGTFQIHFPTKNLNGFPFRAVIRFDQFT